MRAYERLLKYAKVYTTSDPESGTHPSAAREFDLAHLLVEEMKSIGIEDAFVDEHCYVYGSIPATKGCEKKPALGLIAHMDTAPDASGENVKPILHENYDGGDVVLPGTGMVMKTSTFPFLKELKGETLITTDGTTLLGADDKSGVAEILTAAETIIQKKLPHGKLCIAFTPDEEIGEGASLFDIPGFGADFAYTVDGGDVGGIEYENFNAASATVTVHGFSVHPGSAKDAMINASNVAMEFHMALPAMARPETTEGYQGFYHLCQMYGDVTEAKLGYILRDHDIGKLQFKKDNLLHRPHHAECRCGKDDHDHIDMKHRIGDKCRRHQGNIHPRAGLQHLAAKVEHHIQNDRRHTGLHPLEQQGNIVVGGKGVVEHRDDREDDHGRNDGPQHRHEHPDQPLYLPAHQNRRIDGDGTRRGLRQRGHVQHFLLIDPVQLIHKFLLHKGHDDKAAAEGKAADVQCA